MTMALDGIASPAATGAPRVAPLAWPGALQWLSAGARDAAKLFPQDVYHQLRCDHRLGFHRIVVLNDPVDIHRVLTTPGGYRLSNLQRRLLSPLLGEGLAVADGLQWQTQRADAGRMAANAHRSMLDSDLDQCVGNSLDMWPINAPFALLRQLKILALNLIAEMIFRASIPIATPAVMDAVEAAEASLETFDLLDALGAPPWAISPKMLGALSQAHRFDALIGETLNTVEKSGHTPRLQAQDRRRRRDFVVSMLSGFESVALASFWLLMELSRRPALVAELVRHGAPTASVLRPLIAETLRLYPSLPFILRVARRADTSITPTIPSGAMVCISPWILHRHEAHWSHPALFDPKRFEETKDPGPAYMPFGIGARRCVGMHIAQRMIGAIVGGVLARWHVDIVTGNDVAPRLSVSLRPDRLVLAHLSHRKSAFT